MEPVSVVGTRIARALLEVSVRLLAFSLGSHSTPRCGVGVNFLKVRRRRSEHGLGLFPPLVVR